MLGTAETDETDDGVGIGPCRLTHYVETAMMVMPVWFGCRYRGAAPSPVFSGEDSATGVYAEL